jgi:flagellar L-ring protein precursor FlgH
MAARKRYALPIAGCLAASAAGCASGGADFMREPRLSAVGSGLAATMSEDAVDAAAARRASARVNPPARSVNLYTDQRIAEVGDIVTVVIAINDKATFGNSTDRSQTAKTGLSLDGALKYGATSPTSLSASTSSDLSSSSTSQGQGNINRSEQIQVSVAAVVTDVLPNGNLIVSGSQEVRVNYELRQLTVAGIVRPSDIARNNTIAYDHVAEARISYGGRGRISEVQQPAWGQQIYDSVKPF